MKKYRSICSLCYVIMALTLFFQACKKETQEPTTETGPVGPTTEFDESIEPRSDEFDYSACPSLKSTVYKTGGMLVFQNREHFEKCAICLEKEYDDYNDAYDAQYPNATPEELDSLDVVNNFNEWAPYIAFEGQHNFASLRAKVESQTNLWLAITPADEIDFDDNPDDIVPVMEESVRALLNEDGFAKAGSDTIKQSDWLDKDFWDDCAFLHSRKRTFDLNDDPLLVNRKLIVKIKIKSGLVNSNLIGKITNYRKIDGNYKLRRARLKIGATGDSQNDDCVVMPQFWSKYKGYKNRRSLKVNSYIWRLWREALAEEDNPRWMMERCVAHGYWDNANNYYPVPLSR